MSKHFIIRFTSFALLFALALSAVMLSGCANGSRLSKTYCRNTGNADYYLCFSRLGTVKSVIVLQDGCVRERKGTYVLERSSGAGVITLSASAYYDAETFDFAYSVEPDSVVCDAGCYHSVDAVAAFGESVALNDSGSTLSRLFSGKTSLFDILFCKKLNGTYYTTNGYTYIYLRFNRNGSLDYAYSDLITACTHNYKPLTCDGSYSLGHDNTGTLTLYGSDEISAHEYYIEYDPEDDSISMGANPTLTFMRNDDAEFGNNPTANSYGELAGMFNDAIFEYNQSIMENQDDEP